MNPILRAFILTLSGFLLPACGGGGGSDAPEIQVDGGWARAMLLGLTKSLVEGDSIRLTLHFQRSGDLVVTIPVRLGSPSDQASRRD